MRLRVLAEVDAVARRGTANARLPQRGPAVLFQSFMLFAMGAVDPPVEQLQRAAHWMSPYHLGTTLDIPADEIRAHLDCLISTGLVERDSRYRLPERRLMVVRPVRVTRQMTSA